MVQRERILYNSKAYKTSPRNLVLAPRAKREKCMSGNVQELTRRGLRFVRYADDVTVFSMSRKAAKRIMARLVDFLENTMKFPVNKDKTKVIKIGELSLLGVYYDHGCWHIEVTYRKLRTI